MLFGGYGAEVWTRRLKQQDLAAGSLGAVVIGRNEGARLVACLESLSGAVRPLVYVDSGSTDGSVAAARAAGALVVAVSRVDRHAGPPDAFATVRGGYKRECCCCLVSDASAGKTGEKAGVFSGSAGIFFHRGAA
jgi:hypothetical protein